MLAADDADFSATRTYIERYILQALSIFDTPEEERNTAYRNLMALVPAAAKRYLENPERKEFRFSTYFGWYISEESKKYSWKRRSA